MSSLSARLAGWRQTAGLGVARMILYFAAYVGLAWISFIYPARGLNITPWNPQAALAVGLLLWQPRSWWLVWVAVVSGEALVGNEAVPWPAMVLSAGTVTAGYAATAAALRLWIAPKLPVVTRRDVVVFLAVVAGGALLGAVLRAAALWATDVVPAARIPAVIHRAFIGDCVGLVVTLPVLWVLASRERTAATRTMLRAGEAWLIAVVTAVAMLIVFAQPTEEQFKYFYLLFLPVVWAAARFGAIGAVWSAALVQMLLMLAVQTATYQPLTVFELQVLMAALTSTGVLLGATVDEREEAQQALRASLRLAAAGDMAAALAHELNQPLTAMSTYARASQLIARKLGSQPNALVDPLVEVTDKLADEATRAGEVVNRLRKFFRDRSTELQPTDIGQLIVDAVQSQERRAEGLGVNLAWSCDPGLGAVWLDPVQITVVLRNLLANAIDAASADREAAPAQRHVTIRALQEDDQVIVTVVDTARGLNSAEVSRVFESRRSEKPGGMGVGLAISRSIVEAHGGRLWAEAGPGGKFHFSLPVTAGVPT
ncbi:ATP-binding protein [Ramlibacter alkalitolerans]|uniref:histidine kinase n=1 Tax=Ramlibacter alkalitolerans TaxID=2039631 RepID=A0ABS1JPN4_9BURK|nr:ATP-binding protein [Ramlibacter alkalitolerans]MBL0426234.1 MASE1 domain-containing protein [Ramlibacter alkalitolerans]